MTGDYSKGRKATKKKALYAALNKLPEMQRQYMMLKLAGNSSRLIAALMDKDDSGVRRTLRRAERNLERMLKEESG